jgi:cellulose synthase/poly-beta-1,6-N-acetylglucosamine synthase-like glycosyltransferase
MFGTEGTEGVDGRRRGSALTVSVVVPVRNAPKRIAACIEALLAQTYPQDRLQIVIVDNDSDDDTPDVIDSYPVTRVTEGSAHSPYTARNAGIAVAAGDIIAFTDANCVPTEEWLANGVRALLNDGADLVGGRISFTFSTRPAVGEIVDAMTNVDVEASIANHRACMTGNLFVRRTVIAEIGVFSPSIRSGGDMRWTRRASDAGFRLVYAGDAEVLYPARSLGPLLRKQIRVGRGVPGVWASFGMSRLQMTGMIARGLLPMPPGRLVARMRERTTGTVPYGLARLWLGVWLCKAARSVGCVSGMLARRPRED